MLSGEPQEPLFGVEPPKDVPETAGEKKTVEMPPSRKAAASEENEQRKEENVVS